MPFFAKYRGFPPATHHQMLPDFWNQYTFRKLYLIYAWKYAEHSLCMLLGYWLPLYIRFFMHHVSLLSSTIVTVVNTEHCTPKLIEALIERLQILAMCHIDINTHVADTNETPGGVTIKWTLLAALPTMARTLSSIQSQLRSIIAVFGNDICKIMRCWKSKTALTIRGFCQLMHEFCAMLMKFGPTCKKLMLRTSSVGHAHGHDSSGGRSPSQNIRMWSWRFSCCLYQGVSGFLARTSALILFLHVQSSAAKPVVPPKARPVSNDLSYHDTDTGMRIWSFCLLFVLTVLTALIGPKVKPRDPMSTSIVLAFSFAVAVGIANDLDLPLYFTGVFSGISYGSSIWLWRLTAAEHKSIIGHTFRYLVPCVVFWIALCAFLRTNSEESSQSPWVASIKCLSVFGAVGVNALYNEKLRELIDFIAWVLRLCGFERIPAAEEAV